VQQHILLKRENWRLPIFVATRNFNIFAIISGEAVTVHKLHKRNVKKKLFQFFMVQHTTDIVQQPEFALSKLYQTVRSENTPSCSLSTLIN